MAVGAKSDVTSVDWYKDSTSGTKLFTDEDFQFDDNKLTSTYSKAADTIQPSDAGTHVCQFTLSNGNSVPHNVEVKVHCKY